MTRLCVYVMTLTSCMCMLCVSILKLGPAFRGVASESEGHAYAVSVCHGCVVMCMLAVCVCVYCTAWNCMTRLCVYVMTLTSCLCMLCVSIMKLGPALTWTCIQRSGI